MKYRLGDICTITKGETGIMKAIPGAYTMVALGEANKTHNEFQFDTKAVIIPLVSSTGHGHASMKRVKYQEGKFALGSILCAVIPKDEKIVLAKYLHIYLHWNREELLVSQMKGMANVSLPMNKIADVFVTVPSIEKQQEIIDLEVQLVEKELSVEKLLSDQLNQIENLNQAILQEAVQGKLVKQDKKDEPASELLKRIKAEKVKSGKKEKPLPPIKPEEIPFEIPENWVWCRLGEICEIKGGKRVRNGYKLLRTPTDHIYIRVTDMKNGSISKNDIHYIDEKMFEAIKQYTISENDLYITIAGTIGEVGEVPEMFNGANLTENAAKFVFDNELVNRIWLRNILSSKHSQVQFLDKTKKVTAQPKLALTRIATTLIPLPPLAEQNNIVTETEKQKAKTKQLKEHIIANQQATEQLLKALLHQAFEVEESVGV
jgi:type I restriction enzyme S subunit